MSLLSDLFGDGSLLDKLQSPPQWTATTHPDDKEAAELLETAPFAAMRECAEAFGQWYDQWRIGYDAESAAKVYAWLTSVGEMFDRQGRKLGG